MVLDNACDPDPRVEKEARSLVEAGHEVTILAWDRSARLPRLEARAGAQIVRLPVSSGNNRGMGQLWPMVRFWLAAVRGGVGRRYDLVHCHDLPSLPVGVLLSAIRRRPLVYDAHEIYGLMMRTRLSALACRLLGAMERMLLRRVDRVVTVSTMLEAHYRRLHPAVDVVGNWYDAVELDAVAGRDLRRRLGIAQETFVVTYVGFLGPERLHSLLIDYAHAHPEVAVIIAGGGVNEPDVAAAAVALPNLHYLGWVSDPSPVFAAADALFYGLVARDPYSRLISPNNLFLAIAMRKPLITTALGDAGRIVGSEGAGVLVDPPTVEQLDAAVQKLRDPRWRAHITQVQTRLQERYSWQRAAAVLCAVHDAAANGRDPRRAAQVAR